MPERSRVAAAAPFSTRAGLGSSGFRQRAELIAERLTRWTSIANA